MSLFQEKKSFFGRLSEKLSDVIMARAEVDEDLMDELEEVLITSDIGAETAGLLNFYARSFNLHILFFFITTSTEHRQCGSKQYCQHQSQ